ncbi:TPA: DUF624 domain-containing protein [Vibrio parahaemolyticus]|uniref:DUF624 domain-containing protein n=1 Tax=Vibrio aestuarianus TaxID=28171 RepID=A0AAX3U7K4_9VIBR|nr:DUF624 domain-containing protein [Vibrio aestuarianus]WGK83261.1 DUF624 domain-containing protein [Vibrio aestuarianus]HBC3930637.1 DUF624 domain-containing protein [Vibrio parahaemolyticus]
MNSSSLINACHWITRLAWLNVIWLVLSLLGGVVFGVLPSTVTVCYLIRKYLNGAAKVTFTEAFQIYREEFYRSNRAGLTLLLPAFSLLWYINWAIINLEGISTIVMLCGLPIAVIMLVLTYCTLVQLSIYKTNGLKDDLKNAVVLLVEEKRVVVMTFIVFLVGTLLLFINPIVGMLFSVSPALFCTIGLLWISKEELKYQY